MMKRMLIVGQSDNPGGVESVIKRYFDVIKKDYHVDLLVFSKICYDEKYYLNNGCNIFFIRNAQFRSPLAYKKEVKNFFDKSEMVYDVLWFNCCDLANCGYIMKQAKTHGIKKRIIHAHNNQLMQTGKKRIFYSFMHNYWKYNIDSYATDFWACSDLAGDFFYKKSILNSNHYKIIYNPIDTDEFKHDPFVRRKMRDELGIPSDCTVIGHVGRFQYQKNHEFLINIFNSFHKKHPNSKLLLVGQGVEENKIKLQVKQLNLEKDVLFLGIRNDVNRIMQVMDLFLLPSRFEGLGIVLIEAQAACLPCITSFDVVPQHVNITGNVSFVSLNDNIDNWVKEIDKQLKKKIDSTYVFNCLVSSGYDMKTASSNFIRDIED